MTRAIEQAAAGLENRPVELVVLSGQPYEGHGLHKTKVSTVEGLGYRTTASPEHARKLAGRLMGAATRALGGPPDVWHVHNHAFGKNVALPGAMNELLLDGARLILQMHEFAEDGNPALYQRLRNHYEDRPEDFALHLYPRGRQVHYVTLSSREAGFLREAGFRRENVHVLPGAFRAPVTRARDVPLLPEARRVLVYPVRGIRRKNLGELLMLSTLAGPGVWFIESRAPETPAWKTIHDEWGEFAKRKQLPVILDFEESSPEISHAELLGRADGWVTTSVRESSGAVFLEPWLAEKPLFGRNLPDLTEDYTAKSVRLDHLYDTLEVPLKWIDERELFDRFNLSLGLRFESYGRAVPEDAADQLWNQAVTHHRVDFGRLDEDLQRQVLDRVLAEPKLRHSIVAPVLDGLPESMVAHNRPIIASRLGLEEHGRRLYELYEKAANSLMDEPDHHDPEAVLDAFLAPENLLLLCPPS